MADYRITVDTEINSSQLDEVEKKIKSLKNQKTVVNLNINSKQLATEIAQSLKNIKGEVQVDAKVSKTSLQKLNKALSSNKYMAQMSRMQTQVGKFGATGPLTKQMSALQDAYNSLQKFSGKVVDESDFNEADAAVKRFNTELERTKNLYSAMSSGRGMADFANKQEQITQNFRNQRNILDKQIVAWLNNNSRAADDFGDRLDDVRLRLSQLNGNDVQGLKNLKAEFQSIKLEASALDKTGLTFGDRLKKQFNEYISYIGVAGALATAGEGFRYMAQNVLEVDTAMTGLYRVTDLTSKQYDTMFDRMISSAQQYGNTLTDTINATSDWVRAGFDENTSLDLAEITSMYQHVSDLDYSEAAENLLTAYKGFQSSFNQEFGNDAAASVEHIADAFNELDNQYSVTSAGLGEGLARSASALQLAGNTFEEAAALIGATSEVTQDPEKAGNAMKTLSLRLRGMKGELEELGEETEGVENISKMQGQILNMTKGKVNIFDDAGNFKSTYDIMKGIAEVYDDLSSTDQADLLETIAGKNRANDVAALISNFPTAIKMVETAENSAGSAAQENEKYLDSLQGRIDVMTASLQALSVSTLDSDFLKGGVSAITGFLDVLKTLIDTVGVLPTVLAAAGAGFSLFGKRFINIGQDAETGNAKLQMFGKSIGEIHDIIGSFVGNKGSRMESALNTATGGKSQFDTWTEMFDVDEAAFNKLTVPYDPSELNNYLEGTSEAFRKWAQDVNNAGKTFADFKKQQGKDAINSITSNNSFKNFTSLIDEYNSTLDSVDGTSKRFGMTQREITDSINSTNSVAKNYIGNLNGTRASITGYTASLVGATVKTFALEAASIALQGVLTMGIGVAIGAVITLITDWINAEQKLAETVEEATSSYKQQHDELSKGKASFEEAAQSYEKLSKGVDKLTGKNKNLTTDAYEEYANAVNTIADMAPNLVAGYDAQGNAILNVAANVDELTDAYNDLIIAENNKLLNGDGEEYEGISSISENLKNQFNDLKKETQNGNIWADSLNEVFDSGNVSSDNIIDKVGSETKHAALEIAKEMEAANKTIEGIDPPNMWTNQEDSAKYISEVYKQYPEIIRAAIGSVDTELDTITEKMRIGISAHMENAFLQGDYSNLDEEMQSFAFSIINGLDSGFIAELNDTGGQQAVFDYVDNILNTLNGMESNAQRKLQSVFDLQSSFDSGELTVAEYKKQLDEIESVIDGLGLDGKITQQIKLSLNIDEVQDQYDALLNRLGGEDNEAIANWINNLSGEEFNVAMNMELDGSEDTVEELQKTLDLAMALNAADTLSIDTEISGLEALNTAMEESNSVGGLMQESIDGISNRFADLESYDPSKLFEKSANGIKLNQQELRRLNDEYEQTRFDEADEQMDKLVNKYNELTEQIDQTSNAAERSRLIADREQYGDAIQELAKYQAQLEGATNAYQKWIDAQNTPDEREEYSSIAKSYEDIQEEMNRGWLDDDTKAYIDLLSGDDLANATYDEYMNAWNQVQQKIGNTGYSILDFFTLDEDGNETSDGIFNFFDAVAKEFGEGYAKIDEETGKYSFDLSGDKLEEVANKFKMDTAAVQSILEAAVDAGFEVDWDSLTDGIDLATSDFETLVGVAEAAQDSLNNITGKEYDFNFTADSVEVAQDEINKAQNAYEQLITNPDGTLNLNAEGAEELRAIISTLIFQKQQLEEPAIMSIDTSQMGADVQKVISDLMTIQTAYWDLEQSLATGDPVQIQVSTENLASALDTYKQNPEEIRTKLGAPDDSAVDAALATLSATPLDINTVLSETSIGSLASQISAIKPDIVAQVTGLDVSQIQGQSTTVTVTPTPTTTDLGSVFTGNGKVDMTPITTDMGADFTGSGLTNMSPTTYNMGSQFYGSGTVKVTYQATNSLPGVGGVNGTAHSNGTANGRAFARGNWGTKDDGVALVGELGQETVVRDGRFFTIGDNGAEFFNYKKGDIIFNHKQTEELFKNGYVTSGGGRGRAFAEGTAFAVGGASGSGPKRPTNTGGSSIGGTTVVNNTTNNYNYNTSKSASSSSKKSSSSSKKAAEEFSETLDWIEVLIDRIERSLGTLDTIASSAFRSWSERTNALNEAMAVTRQEIDLQNQAYQRYMQEANSVGLSADWVNKIQNGLIDIETIGDEALNDQIERYKEYYEKALDAKDAVLELKEALGDLAQQKFENVEKQFAGALNALEFVQGDIEAYVKREELEGHFVSEKYYTALMDNVHQQAEQLRAQREEMIKVRDEAINNGTWAVGDENWVKQNEAINEVSLAIHELGNQWAEYHNAIRDTKWEVFDLLQDRISRVADEAQFLIDLMSNEKLFDDNGQLTDKGWATMGLYGQQYNVYMNQADRYAQEIKELEALMAEDPANMDVADRYYELIDAQQEAILSAEQMKDAIKDMVEQGIELELDALDDLIDKYLEALQAQKD